MGSYCENSGLFDFQYQASPQLLALTLTDISPALSMALTR
jgi:hypothetical protein